MKNILTALFLLLSVDAFSCETDYKASRISITDIINTYAQMNGEKVIISPKVRGTATVFGLDVYNLTYGDFLAVLDKHGYTAYKNDGNLFVILSRYAKDSPITTVEDNKTYPGSMYVTGSIKVEKACALRLPPVLRPLLPSHAWLSAVKDSNSILIYDTYANYLRIKHLIHDIDSKTDKAEDCG